MFRRPAIRAGGKIVAFLGFDDELIVKVPERRAHELVTDGVASPVTMQDRTMREWIHIPPGDDDESTLDTWRPYAQEALEYVQKRNAVDAIIQRGRRRPTADERSPDEILGYDENGLPT
jgi:hypothetical protein